MTHLEIMEHSRIPSFRQTITGHLKIISNYRQQVVASDQKTYIILNFGSTQIPECAGDEKQPHSSGLANAIMS